MMAIWRRSAVPICFSVIGFERCVDAKLQEGARCVAGRDRGTTWVRVQLKPDYGSIANANLGRQGLLAFLLMEKDRVSATVSL
jgi:hypothetical protein